MYVDTLPKGRDDTTLLTAWAQAYFLADKATDSYGTLILDCVGDGKYSEANAEVPAADNWLECITNSTNCSIMDNKLGDPTIRRYPGKHTETGGLYIMSCQNVSPHVMDLDTDIIPPDQIHTRQRHFPDR